MYIAMTTKMHTTKAFGYDNPDSPKYCQHSRNVGAS